MTLGKKIKIWFGFFLFYICCLSSNSCQKITLNFIFIDIVRKKKRERMQINVKPNLLNPPHHEITLNHEHIGCVYIKICRKNFVKPSPPHHFLKWIEKVSSLVSICLHAMVLFSTISLALTFLQRTLCHQQCKKNMIKQNKNCRGGKIFWQRNCKNKNKIIYALLIPVFVSVMSWCVLQEEKRNGSSWILIYVESTTQFTRPGCLREQFLIMKIHHWYFECQQWSFMTRGMEWWNGAESFLPYVNIKQTLVKVNMC